MDKVNAIAPIWIMPVSVFVTIFGLATIVSGGSVLFTEAASRAAGDYVPFVVWFNFIVGFAYIAAGIGIWKLQPWAGLLSSTIALATLIVLIAFGIHIMTGGNYEMRTVMAMTFRFSVWAAISYFYCSLKGCRLNVSGGAS